jgi:hypothetical protein
MSEVWVWPGEAAWYFVSLPKEYTEPIKELSVGSRGFGSVRVTARIDTFEWQTSIFPDKKSGCYLLPIKKEVRKICKLTEGSSAQIAIIVFDQQ